MLTRRPHGTHVPHRTTAAEHDELHSTRDEWIGSLWARFGTVDTCPCGAAPHFSEPWTVCRSGQCRRCGIRPRRRATAPRPRAPNQRESASRHSGSSRVNCPAIAGPAAPCGERKFLLHSRFASRTAKSGHRRAAVPTLAAHRAVGRQDDAIAAPGPRGVDVGNASHDGRNLCNGLRTPGPGPTTTVQIATIGTAIQFRQTPQASTSRCADLWEGRRIKDTATHHCGRVRRDSAISHDGRRPRPVMTSTSPSAFWSASSATPNVEHRGAGARGAPYRRWHRQCRAVADRHRRRPTRRRARPRPTRRRHGKIWGDALHNRPSFARTSTLITAHILSDRPGPPVLPRASGCCPAEQIPLTGLRRPAQSWLHQRPDSAAVQEPSHATNAAPIGRAQRRRGDQPRSAVTWASATGVLRVLHVDPIGRAASTPMRALRITGRPDARAPTRSRCYA